MRKFIKAIAPFLFLLAVFLFMLNFRLHETLNEEEKNIIQYYRQEILEIK